jgi:hypothetical protein
MKEETAHMAQMRLIPPNWRCDSTSSHSKISEAILKGDNKYDGSTPKPSLECPLEHTQENKEEPRISFREEEQQEIPEKQQLNLELELETKPRLEFKGAAVRERELAKTVGARTAKARGRLEQKG